MQKSEKWLKANEWERQWWGDCSNTYDEESKQLHYASFMGLNKFKRASEHSGQGIEFDMQGKAILDIGGGPVSLLLKCVNFKKAVVVDPCKFPSWILKRYKMHKIEFINKTAEEIDFHGFDEVWIYNVLQHVIDPDEVIKRAKRAGKVVRIFEWLDTGTNVGHIHILTSDWLDKYFSGKMRKMSENGCFGNAYIDVWEKGKPKTLSFNKRKRFHLLGLAHLATNKDKAIACAFSQKALKMGQMLKSLGHKVFFYGVEGSTVDCDEFIQVVPQELLDKVYGDYDYKTKQYKFNASDMVYTMFNKNAIYEINKRKQDDDYLLVSFGTAQKPIVDAVKLTLSVEMGIGYAATFCKFRVFESYAWMHFLYGKKEVGDGDFYDAVIPNYFDPRDFKYRKAKKDYYLYLGRVIKRKGVEIAKSAVKEIGGRLIIAGQKGEGVDFIDTEAPYIEYVGMADVKMRKKLLSEAKALFVPTIYVGPFEGVSIEAGFSGTPVITTDFGCFTENVIHGVTGYRCRTLEQFIWAAKNIGNIKPANCRTFAMENFTLDKVARMYDEYFSTLYGLLDRGWYSKNPDRKELNWLNKYYAVSR